MILARLLTISMDILLERQIAFETQFGFEFA